MPKKQTVKKKAAAKKASVKGRTKIKQSPRVEKIKILLLIVLAALVGGFTVWIANASQPYKYSLTNCKQPKDVAINFETGEVSGPNKSLIEFQNCVDQSAEAFTYRLYIGLADRKPETLSKPIKSTDGLIYWSNQLVKSSPERVTQKMLCTVELKKLGLTGDKNNGCNAQLARIAYKQKSNQDFVDWLYVKMLGKSAEKRNGKYLYDPSGRAYWKQQLDQNKKTRYQVASAFARSSEAKNRNRAALVVFAAQQMRHQISK